MIFETFLIILYMLAYLAISNFCMNKLWKVLKIKQVGQNEFLSVFYNTLLFSLMIVTLVAVIATKGKTVFIFAIPVLFLFFRSLNNTETISFANQNSNRTVWFSIVFLSILIVIISYYFTLKFSMRNDIAHYVKISECLVSQGIENPYHYYNLENNAFNGLMPYHYFEMWFGGIFFRINKFFHFSALSNFMFYIYVVFNLFRVTFLIGLFGLINKYVKFSALYFLICIPIMMLDISAFCNWWVTTFIAESNFFERPNFIFYFILLVPIFDSLLNDDFERSLIWASIFVICTITALPAIAGSMVLLAVFKFYHEKDKRKPLFFNMVIFFVFIACVLLLYKLFPIAKEVKPIESYTLSQIISKTLLLWKASAYMFFVLFVKIGLFIFLAWGILQIKFIKALNISFALKRIFKFVLFVNIAGIAVFQLVPYMDNTYQMAFIGYCTTILLLGFTIAILVSVVSIKLKIGILAVYIAIIIFGINRNLFNDHTVCQENDWTCSLEKNFLLQYGLSSTYIDSLKVNSNDLAQRNGASIIDGKDAVKEFLGLRFSGIYQLGFYLMTYNNNVHLPLLSDPSFLYPDRDTLSKDYYKAKNFNKLTKFYKNYDNSTGYKQNLNNYIAANEISYFFASTNFRPELYLDSSLIASRIQDSKKGHWLITLSNKNKTKR